MTPKDLYKLTASEVSALIEKDAFSVEQYAQSLIARVKERDPTVKAWVYFDENLVLEQARKLDQVPKGERGPLHGLAIGVKDIIYTKDMPTQFNSPIYKDDAPKLDGASIIVLRKAGALLLGKTTTTEFASTMVGPATGNPHDITRTPGGSSSGSGAAVADFQVPIALGSQTGGSIIRPGSFNGIYGFKPTWNSVPREGQKFSAMMLDTLGFYARGIQDLEILSALFKLEDDEKVEEKFDLKCANIAFCKTEVWDQAEEGTVKAMQKAAEILTSHGAHVKDIALPSEFDDFATYNKRLLSSEQRVIFLGEYQVAKEKLYPALAGCVENREAITRKQQLEAFDYIGSLRPKFDAIAKQYDIVITPSVPGEAPKGLGYTGSTAFCAMWTALHVPAINIPGFKGPNDMPVGLTLIAPRYYDQHLLRVAKEVGKVFEKEGGWRISLGD